MKQKLLYEVPATEVLELRLEGVIAQSPQLSSSPNFVDPYYGTDEQFWN